MFELCHQNFFFKLRRVIKSVAVIEISFRSFWFLINQFGYAAWFHYQPIDSDEAFHLIKNTNLFVPEDCPKGFDNLSSCDEVSLYFDKLP